MKTIVAINFSDVGTSWGPAIHFLEVWNRVHAMGRYRVLAYACCEKQQPCMESPCIQMLFRTGSSSIGRFTIKFLMDLFLFLKLLVARQSIVYIRWSQYCLLTALACRLRHHHTAYEMNGLSREDSKSASASRFRKGHYGLSEFLCLRDTSAHIICVSKAIELSLKQRFSTGNTTTIPNGCKPSLNEINRGVRPQRKHFSLAYVGTFTPWDGHTLLPVVARILIEEKVPVRMLVAGLRLEKSSIYKDVMSMQCFDYRGNVEYAALDAFYATADAGIALYEFERHRTVELSSLKLFEYLACRLPILTTAVPGTEFVEDLHIGMRLREEEISDREKLRQRLNEFYAGFSRYVKAYASCPPGRTWQDVAEETATYLNTNCR